MDSQNSSIKKHLFICQYERSGAECCADKNASQIVDNLKSWVKQNSLQKEIKISRSGCLGMCEIGIAAVIYPEGKWLTCIELTDEENLKNYLT